MVKKGIDPRSPRAIAIDKSKKAKKTLNRLNVEDWKKNRGRTDLVGIDTPPKGKKKTRKRKKRKNKR